MTSGTQWKPYHNKNLPRNPHSAFGDFPKNFMHSKARGVTALSPLYQYEKSIAMKGSPILKKGDGLGGKTMSLNRPKPKPLV